MKETFTLQPLLDIAESQTDTAAAALAVLNRAVQQQEEKLALLIGYRKDYQERLRLRTAGGVDGAGLKNFHEFLMRLEQAIVQQRAAVEEARKRAEAGKQEWQARKRKFKAFDTLSERFDVMTRRKESTREQKVQDDFASRTSRTKSGARR